MLKSLDIKNLTVFAEASLEFSPQLNVIVGENAVGKLHLLKMPYAILATSAEERRKPGAGSPTRASLTATWEWSPDRVPIINKGDGVLGR